MPYTHFTSNQLIQLLVAGVFILFSVIVFGNRQKLAVGSLVFGTFILGCFMANLDPYLNLWDEQYHALVAKNLSQNWLKPMLYKTPVLPFDYKNWTANHVWLHKQPLFLWQMACSIKLFGTNAFAVRLPSIIMHAIIPFFIYRIGSIITSKEVGFYGALLFSTAYFPLELIVGKYSTDHNDIAFLFYVTASLWTWFEYQETSNKKWLYLLGLTSGAAVLVKWLMGLIVFVIWFFVQVLSKKINHHKLKDFAPLFKSMCISFITFIPWQLYILNNFPKEAKHEYSLNGKHFFEVVEKHKETLWFHFTDGLKTIYGSGILIPTIILLGLIMLIKNVSYKKHQLFVIGIITFVYAFFTVAATKMVSFPLIVSPFIFLAFGYLIYMAVSFVKKTSYLKPRFLKKAFVLLLPISIAYIGLRPTKIANYHTDWKPHDNFNRLDDIIEMQFIAEIKKKIGNDGWILCNTQVSHNGHIPIMFFTDHTAYPFLPSTKQLKILKEQNLRIAVIKNGDIPAYLVSDPDILLLDAPKIHTQ